MLLYLVFLMMSVLHFLCFSVFCKLLYTQQEPFCSTLTILYLTDGLFRVYFLFIGSAEYMYMDTNYKCMCFAFRVSAVLAVGVEDLFMDEPLGPSGGAKANSDMT